MSQIGILRFPGTNCDRDVFGAIESLGLKPEWLWYEDRFEPSKYSAFVLPGGFSYGDYLRCGALAARSPVMDSLREAANKGYPILGICNGFQILCESGLLPGALVRNASQRFVDKWVSVRIDGSTTWLSKSDFKDTLKLPVAHGEGRYYVEADVEKELRANDQVWCTYLDNPNGSIGDIAGVMNKTKNVAALMPHPERAFHSWLGGEDGVKLIKPMVGL